MGVTPARAAAALAAGVAIGNLADYFANEAANQSGDSGYYDDYEEKVYMDRTAAPPKGPPMGPSQGPYGPPPGSEYEEPKMSKSETAAYLKTGNIPRRFLVGSVAQNLAMQAREGGKSMRRDGRSARAAVVRKVMADQGMSLPAASKYVKEHGLYSR
jgi:hypothetical protein